jgi:hypothetical protein
MAQQILKLRRSSIPGKVPSTSSLDYGEIALNTYDGIAYMKRSGSNGDEIIAIGIGTSGSFTGSFFGTSSWANNATSASYTLSASYSQTASYVLNSISASYIQTASFSFLSLTSSWATNVNTASWADNAINAMTASWANNVNTASWSNRAMSASTADNAITASIALQANTASYILNAASASYSLSASNAQTASSADDFLVRGTLTAQNIVVQTITSSTDFVTGSTRFGSNLSNTHQFTGSVSITGSLIIEGTGVTGSFYGTSSWANDTISSSYAVSASQTQNAVTASYILNAASASYSLSSSYTQYASIASNILGGTATYIPFFKTDTTLGNSTMYQVSNSFSTTSIAINETNITTDNPEALYVFQIHPTSINVLTGKGNLNNYLQNNIQNTNQGVSASSDIVATANNGNESSNYIDMGINSQNYNAGFIGEANDAYLYSIANNLHIGNANDNDTHVGFFVGGSDVELYNKLQLNPNNQHKMSGSLSISGSLNINNGITGSLFGTSSWAINALTASFASNVPATASYALQALSASNALTASYALNAQGSGFPYTGSAIITGSLIVTGSVNVTLGFTGSLQGTASWAINATTASYALNTVSASFATSASQAQNATTASYVLNAISSSFAATASSADNFTVRSTLTAQTIVAQTITSSTLFVTGSSRFGSLSSSIHQFTGSVRVSGSMNLAGPPLPLLTSPSNFSASIDYNNSPFGYYNEGYTFSFRIYSYKDTLLGRNYSSYTQLSVSDNGNYDTRYVINLTWTSNPSASGYLILIQDDYNGYNFNVGYSTTSTSLQVVSNTSWDSVPTITSNSILQPPNILNVFGDTNISGAISINQKAFILDYNDNVVIGTSNYTASGNINNIFIGQLAGYQATTANSSNFLGNQAGYQATTANSSNFLGNNAGFQATNANNSNFLGNQAGYQATNANDSAFLGFTAGYGATNALRSNFLGRQAGYQATNAYESNFLGVSTGFQATNANNSNFLGNHAGVIATNALRSNFLGYYAGYGAASASYSTLIGFQVAYNFSGPSRSIKSNNIIIGTNITLDSGRQDSINIGGLIFGTGSYSTISVNAFSGSANGRIGINQPLPIFSLDVSGSGRYTNGLEITGSLNAPIITGSLFGTASWASNAVTASYILNAVSASFALSASYTLTSSLPLQGIITASAAGSTITFIKGDNSTFNISITTATAETASYITGSNVYGPYGGNSILSASYAINASFATTASHALNATSASYVQTASFALNTGLLNGTSSAIFATTGSNIFIGNQTVTGSLFTTGSNTLIGSTVLTGSLNISGSTTQTGNNTLLGNTVLSGSIIISGSLGTNNPTVKIYGDTTHNGYIRFDPVSTNIDTSISASYIYVSGSTNDLYFSQNGNGYNNVTRLRWLEGNLYTGLLNGGLITATTGSTTYRISSGSGIIVNLNASLNDNPYPVIQYVNWGNLTGSISAFTSSYQQVFVGIDSTANIFAQGTPFSNGQFDTVINIGGVFFQNGSTINAVKTQPSVAYGFEQAQNIFNRAFGPLKLSGYTLAPSGSSTLGLVVGSGTAYAPGSNYAIDPNEPSYTVDNGTNISKIYRYRQSGSTWVYDTNAGAGYTTIDPGQYSNNGVLTTVQPNDWSIQRVFWFPNSVVKAIIVYYGNQSYSTEAEAIANINIESFVEAPNTAANAIYLGSIVIRGSGVLTTPADFTILPGGLFRQVGGSGGGGSVVTQTLSGLSDVLISGQTSGQALVYDSTAGKWENKSFISASISGNAATATTATTASYVLNTVSSSYSLSASQAQNAVTASYILNAVSASFASTASNVLGGAANYIPLWNEATTLSSSVIYQSSGNVGIGNTSPSFRVDIAGNLRASTGITLPNYIKLNLSNGASVEGYDGKVVFRTVYGSAGYFENNSLGLAPMDNEPNTSGIGILVKNFGSEGLVKYKTAAQVLSMINAAPTSSISGTINYIPKFISASVIGNSLIYDNGANVGIGTTSPNAKLDVNGNTIITGSLIVTVGITGSLFGTASWTNNAISASYALLSSNAQTASYVLNAVSASYALSASQAQNAVTASYVLNAVSASFASTASYILNAVSASYALSASQAQNAVTASYILNAVSASYTLSASNAQTASYVLNAVSASFATRAITASYADNFTVAGTLTAQTLVVQTITSSTDFVTGSTRFGTLLSNTHQFTGSVSITGSLNVTGAGITGSLFGTASWASNAITASNALTASFVQNAVSASFAISASQAVTASYVLNAISASFANTASYVLNAVSASYVLNAVSSSFATTASYILNAVSASFATSASQAQNAVSASFATSASFTATSSYSNNFTVANQLIIDATLTDYATVASSIVGSNNMFTQATGSYTSAFFKYTVSSGSNTRAGEVVGAWNGSTVQYYDNSTVDVGNTTAVTSSVSIVSGNVQFNVQTNTSGWRIKSLATFI